MSTPSRVSCPFEEPYRRELVAQEPQSRNGDVSGGQPETTPFLLIQCAYDVLSDAAKRYSYDRFRAEKIDAEPPGTPANRAFEGRDSVGRAMHEPSVGQKRKMRGVTTLEQVVECTLEELYTGCTKAVPVDLLGKHVVTEVEIERGFLHGTRLELQLAPDMLPKADTDFKIALILHQLAHEYYRIEGSNLMCIIKVPLIKALNGFTMYLQHLDGREIKVHRPGPMSPGTVFTIPGEGMPIRKQGKVTGTGDLRVQLEVQFPAYLTTSQKQQIRQMFEGCPDSVDDMNVHQFRFLRSSSGRIGVQGRRDTPLSRISTL